MNPDDQLIEQFRHLTNAVERLGVDSQPSMRAAHLRALALEAKTLAAMAESIAKELE